MTSVLDKLFDALETIGAAIVMLVLGVALFAFFTARFWVLLAVLIIVLHFAAKNW